MNKRNVKSGRDVASRVRFSRDVACRVRVCVMLTLMLAMSVSVNAQTIRYVKPTATGTGDGSSWTDAAGSIQNMIDVSSSGDQIWIAGGNYSLSITLQMKSGVHVYGGFAGTENDTSQRVKNDLDKNGTIEPWEFTNATVLEGRTYNRTVGIKASNLTIKTVLDGISVTKYEQSAIAIENNSVFVMCNNTISENSNGQYNAGGGIYISGGSTVDIHNNNISKNSAGQYNAAGGGIYISGGSTVDIHNNIISENSANESISYGTHEGSGGGICIVGSIVSLHNNTILRNGSCFGGGINISEVSTVDIHNNIISENSASGSVSYNSIGAGGGITTSGSTVDIHNNVISENYARNAGGIAASGGGVFTVNIHNNTISGNSAYSGGGVSIGGINLYNNIISENKANKYGGGVYVNGKCNIINNLISNNNLEDKSSYGGGIILDESNAMLINNTIVYNNGETGGGVCCVTSSPILINNILYGNSSSLKSQIFINDNNSAPKMRYNLLQCNCIGLASGVTYDWDANADNNFDENPQFVNYALKNYRLSSNSPCINAGIQDVTGLGLPSVDLDGKIRIHGGRIDIGAYEYGAPATIKENIITQQLIIYPNPATNQLTIACRDAACHVPTVEIYSVVGQKLLSLQSSQSQETTIDVSPLANGIYFLKIGNQVTKFIKE